VEKALLKAPFKFSQRVSSHFSHSRYHPILKKRMPHYGVDYAAPRGTPVLAVGDGVVTEARYRGANGNIVKINHNASYRTAYLHLQGFASGIQRGAKVAQGQIIGYVGSTGRSTGSHLDYRLYKNDRAVNPLTVDLPSSEAVPDSLMDDFKKVRDTLEQHFEQENNSTSKVNSVVVPAK
jgi:murein DD-endopeptidase MepM/ murein hydrolase activator NlpD